LVLSAMAIGGGAMIVSAATSIAQLGSDIDGEASSEMGRAVSLSADGTVVAIGAPFDAGQVRIYQYSNGSWSQLGLAIAGEADGDQSGFSVSLSSDGTTVAIGAPLNGGNGESSGHVRVYEWNGSAWVQKGGDIDGEVANDKSGHSVSLSADGTEVAIGAPDGGSSGAGYVRIYQWNGSVWVQKGGDIDGEVANDKLGYSVSLSADGTEVAIGAINHDPTDSYAGTVRIYQWNGSVWVQVGSDIDGDEVGNKFGHSVSLSADGTEVAIGAPDGGLSGAGHVRVYEWNGSGWVQKGGDIDGEAQYDLFGYSVSLSADSSVLAIGAKSHDNFAGSVRIYKYSNGSWSQVGSDIDGEAANNGSGHSLSLSADGTRVAIGAPFNSSSAGHVRIYSITESLNITYDSQGGSAVSDGDAATTVGGTIGALPTAPTRDGYTFVGWFTAASGGSEITTSAAHNQTADFTLYAQWLADLALTYDSQGGSAVSDGDAATTVGGTIGALPTAPTRDGYTFAGWFTAASGGSEITTSAAHNQTADFTLYAQWTANPTTTTTVAPTTTTVAPVAVELPATGSSGGTVAQVLLVLGIGGLVMLVTRRRLNT